MRKKGMLLASETLKMVIAVICIGFLVYLIAAIYFSNSDAKQKEEATELMDRIKLIVNAINSGNKTSEQVTDIIPAGWMIFSYSLEEKKPDSCLGKTCLCICDDVVDIWDRQINECSDDGVCHVLDNLMENEDIEIGSAKNPTSIEVSKYGIFWSVKKI